MTIKSILKSKACDGNKNDKKCAKALNKYIKKKYKHKKHKGGAGSPSAKVINKINFNQPASVAQAPAVVSTAIPQPRATGQGIPADVPYKNLVNQKTVYETKLKNAQKENVRLLALSKLNSSSTGSSTMNDATTMTDTGKAGRPKVLKINQKILYLWRILSHQAQVRHLTKVIKIKIILRKCRKAEGEMEV